MLTEQEKRTALKCLEEGVVKLIDIFGSDTMKIKGLKKN